MHRNLRLLRTLPLAALLLGGCSTAPPVKPQFGQQTMTLLGAVRFNHRTESVVADAVIRYEGPARYELVVTNDDGSTYCHVLEDRDRWSVEFPASKRSVTGHGAPGPEDIGLWVESAKMVEMAIKQAQFADSLTSTMKGNLEAGRQYQIELSEFRKVVGQLLATRMKLTCRGCQSSLEIAIRTLK